MTISVPASKKPNPWLSIWLKPRETMRQIMQENDRRYDLWLVLAAALLGVPSLTHAYITLTDLPPSEIDFLVKSLPKVPAFLAVIVCTAIVLLSSFAFFFFNSWLTALAGKWFGSAAPERDVRRAIAWALVPTICATPIGYLELLLGQGADPLSANLVTVLGIAGFAVLLWEYVIYVFCVAEVQGFGFLKATVVTLIPGLIMTIFAVAVIIFLMTTGLFQFDLPMTPATPPDSI